ncbi:TolC family protein [Marivirga salinae]|uniref:TolC family protein n=1 Tax=Marivirga salinarum TaxID=3059078 RepID=A0AA49GCR0_9BACT|nr:TolC family protein [Marivirga sp. BDSF4-3]WKK77033.2 TolC family protein [Marivirga sp. BDSF4-3]
MVKNLNFKSIFSDSTLNGRTLFFFLLFLSASSASISQANEIKVQELTFNEYLQQVLLHNLSFIREKYEVSATEASLLAAKVYENPELEMLSPQFMREEFSNFPANIEYELQIPIVLFGKRRYRIEQARAEKLAANANLEDFLLRLRADAARNFIEVLKNQLLIEKMESILEQWNSLIQVNTDRNQNINRRSKIDSLQIRIETRTFKAGILDLKIRFTELKANTYLLLGGIPKDSLVFDGDLMINLQIPHIDSLLKKLSENRPDLISASYKLNAAEAGVQKAQANRLPNINLIVGYEYGSEFRQPFNAFLAGVALPLKFSGLNSGKYKVSLNRLEQAKLSVDIESLEAETELRKSWEKYRLIKQKRTLFAESILEDAQNARSMTMQKYKEGQASLLSVFESERTLSEIFRRYYDTLSSYAHSIIDLSEASGTWFVEWD